VLAGVRGGSRPKTHRRIRQRQQTASRIAVIGGWSNENGPDVKLGSKRQGRYRLLDWEKPEEANLGRNSSPTR